MSEQKDSYSSTFTGGTPVRKRLNFYDQEEDVCNAVTKTTMKRRRECMGVPALKLNMNESDIRPASDLFNKKAEAGALFAEGERQFTSLAAALFCAWETLIKMSRLKLRHFLLSQMATRNFIATLVGFSFMKQQ